MLAPNSATRSAGADVENMLGRSSDTNAAGAIRDAARLVRNRCSTVSADSEPAHPA